MKAILMSIRPQHLVNILNGKKTIELRKQFPSDYRGWVYMYVTKAIKGKPTLIRSAFRHAYRLGDCYVADFEINLSGKVVARFWVDNVIKMPIEDDGYYSVKPHDIPMHACLTITEINQYGKGKDLFAIRITKLEIFDKPKEISEFYYYKKRWVDCGVDCPPYVDEVKTQLSKAPQSYQYIDIEE